MYRYSKHAAIAKRIAALFVEFAHDQRRDIAIAKLRQDQANVADIAVLEEALHNVARNNDQHRSTSSLLITALKEI